MTPELLAAKVEADIAKSLAQLSSGDADEKSLRQSHPSARYRAPHPVFDLSCSLLSLSLTSGATEIRLVPALDSVDVHMEVNGVFRKTTTLPKELQEPIVARFKDAANLDVTEHTHPQTGSWPTHWQSQNKDFEMLTSFVPSENGEQVAVRFVPK